MGDLLLTVWLFFDFVYSAALLAAGGWLVYHGHSWWWMVLVLIIMPGKTLYRALRHRFEVDEDED